MVRDTNDLVGWALEATLKEDPIDANNSLYWRFGILTQENQVQLPTENQNWEAIYFENRNPGDSQLPTTSTVGSLTYYPVNGIPLYWILGDSNNSATPAHTLSNINSGSLPTITIRSESTGGTVEKFESARGTKITSLSGFINFLSNKKLLSEVITYMAFSNSNADLQAAHTGYKYPTSDYTLTGTQRDERYRSDTNTLLSWNSNDIITDVTMFKYDLTNLLEPVPIENQADPGYLDEGKYTYSFSIGVWRGNTNTEAMNTDYKAGNERTMIFTIYNGGTYYRTITFTKAKLTKREYPLGMGKYSKLYIFHGYAEDVSAVVHDGTSDSFYED